MLLRRTRGFTLIELLVVMAIIVILVSLLTVGLMGARDKAKNKGSRGLVNKIKIALETYHGEFREYPPDGYDNEGTFDFDTAGGTGILVGTPGTGAKQYRMKGTAALMYFLCRPLIKITYVGADISDPRNRVLKRVGPFMELSPGDYSMGKRGHPSDGEPVVFNANHDWTDDEYWDEGGSNLGYKNCEIVDAYGRPLCYDKVKTSDLPGPTGGKYWDPVRFQNPGASAVSSMGHNVHSDRDYLDSGMVDLLSANEPEAYADADFDTILDSRFDPRFRAKAPPSGTLPWDSEGLGEYLNSTYFEKGNAGTATPKGNDNTHEPKFTGGYDLWSCGRSWIDPRDDIKSWGD